MANDPLAPSKENVARAERKFHHLKGSINRFIQSNPYTLRWERSADFTHIITHRNKDIDPDVSFDVVEIVQRLRIALDKATVAMVEKNGRGTSGVGFPFGSIDGNTGQPNPFPDERMTGKYGLKKKLSAPQWDFICAQRPYPGGNKLLWAINEIANEDKHRKDLVSVQPTVEYGMNMYHGTIDTMFMRPSQFQHVLTDQERETVMVSMGPKASQANLEHTFGVCVVFGNGIGADGFNVLSTLNEQIRITDSIIRDFRDFF